MPALIAHHVVPFLVFEFFPNPLHAPWVKRDWRMGNASEDGPPDVFPTFRFLRPIIPISGQDPEHMIAAPAGYHVASQKNGLILREGNPGVDQRFCAAVDRPEQHGRA